MKLSNWKNLFAPHILKRGEAYYDAGFVTIKEIGEEKITAVVEGSELYEVHIWMDYGHVNGMNCTCPYAAEGNACKHMAAVLYEVEDKDFADAETTDMQNWKELEQAIAKLSKKDAHKLLLELAEAYPDTGEFVLLHTAKQLPKSSITQWRRKLKDVENRYSDRSGFIDYYNALAFTDELEALLDSALPDMIQAGLLEDAFHWVCDVYLTATNVEMDDSDGGLGMLIGCCEGHWEDILAHAGQDLSSEMYQWFSEQSETDPYGFIEPFMLRSFRDEDSLKRNLAYIDSKIESSKDDDWRLMDYVCQKLNIMEEMDLPRAEIDHVIRQYYRFPDVRRHLIERTLSEKRFDDAITLLEESKGIDKDAYNGADRWCKRLIALYQELGREEELKKELRFYLTHCSPRDLEYVTMLKELTDEDSWPEVRETLLRSPSIASIANLLLESEGLYDRLMESIRKSGLISLVDRFTDTLLPHYPDELLALNLDYLRREMKTANSRKHYYTLIQRMKTLKRYPCGKLEAKKLADEWRAAYPRRSSMFDELKKAGF
ncbi:MAG: SWIM zinc finger family protein [Oscillospiraceae bacterium]|nr:SWIM zinc finger family protein [Oscillospiraceae bacterium]